MQRIVIIGAGAAGMMAAATIGKELKQRFDDGKKDEVEIYLIEKNAILGRKVIISGGGRCNVTTANNDKRSLMKAYPRGAKFLRYAMYEFSPQDVFDWFEEKEIALKYEGPKVFPKSNDGKEITAMYDKLLKSYGVKVLLRTALQSVEKIEGDMQAGSTVAQDSNSDAQNIAQKFKLNLKNSDGGDSSLSCDKLILTTGGHAYRHTGSTGDGYSFAQSLGHSLTPLAASLTSFSCKEEWVKELSGVSLEKVKMKIIGKEKHEFSGALLFTHKGISGPGVFALSALSAYEECNKEKPLSVYLDFVENKNYDQLFAELMKRIQENPQKNLQHNLGGFVPKSLVAMLLKVLDIDAGKKSSEVGKKDLNRIVEALKNLELKLTERTPGAEIVTAGGIDLQEVDNKTMESKICPGLYFGGELLDIDGFTGGYNLQVAWCTGRLIGKVLSQHISS